MPWRCYGKIRLRTGEGLRIENRLSLRQETERIEGAGGLYGNQRSGCCNLDVCPSPYSPCVKRLQICLQDHEGFVRAYRNAETDLRNSPFEERATSCEVACLRGEQKWRRKRFSPAQFPADRQHAHSWPHDRSEPDAGSHAGASPAALSHFERLSRALRLLEHPSEIHLPAQLIPSAPS